VTPPAEPAAEPAKPAQDSSQAAPQAAEPANETPPADQSQQPAKTAEQITAELENPGAAAADTTDYKALFGRIVGAPIRAGGKDITIANVAAPLTIDFSSDLPSSGTQIQNLSVPVLVAGDSVPTSVLGLARLLERKLNEVLANKLKGAAARCEPNENGLGLRVYADFDQSLLPNTRDAVLTLANTGALKLNAAASTR
jgi:hypothetical protein